MKFSIGDKVITRKNHPCALKLEKRVKQLIPAESGE